MNSQRAAVSTEPEMAVIATARAVPSGRAGGLVGRGAVELTLTKLAITARGFDGRAIDLPFAEIRLIRVGYGAPQGWRAFLGARLEWRPALRIWLRKGKGALRFFAGPESNYNSDLADLMIATGKEVLERHQDIRLETGANFSHSVLASIFFLVISVIFMTFGLSMLFGDKSLPKVDGWFGVMISLLAGSFAWTSIRQIPRPTRNLQAMERILKGK